MPLPISVTDERAAPVETVGARATAQTSSLRPAARPGLRATAHEAVFVRVREPKAPPAAPDPTAPLQIEAQAKAAEPPEAPAEPLLVDSADDFKEDVEDLPEDVEDFEQPGPISSPPTPPEANGEVARGPVVSFLHSAPVAVPQPEPPLVVAVGPVPSAPVTPVAPQPEPRCYLITGFPPGELAAEVPEVLAVLTHREHVAASLQDAFDRGYLALDVWVPRGRVRATIRFEE